MAQRLGGYAVVLLVVAGQFKSHPALAWLEFDLTLVAGVIVVAAVALSMFSLGRPTRGALIPIIIWVSLIPTIATADQTSYGSTKVFTLFTVTFALAFAPFYLLRTPLQRRSFLHALVVGGFIAAIDVMRGGTSVELYGRVAAEGTDTIGTARLAMAGAVALIVIATSRGARPVVRLASVGGAGVLATVALMTGSRGPALAAAVSVVIAVALAPMFKKYRVRALIAIGALVAVAVYVLAREGNVGFVRILSFLNGESDTSSSARTFLWEAAWDGIARSTAGYGWGSFAEIGGVNPYPHNLLLEVGYEVGILAMIALAGILLAGFISSARRATDSTGVAFFTLLVFSVFNAMVSSDVNGSRLMIAVLFASWAVAIPKRGESELQPQSMPQARPGTRSIRLLR